MRIVFGLLFCLLFSPTTSAQTTVRGCCVDPGYYATPEARRQAAEIAALQRRLERPAVVTAPTFAPTFQLPAR